MEEKEKHTPRFIITELLLKSDQNLKTRQTIKVKQVQKKDKNHHRLHGNYENQRQWNDVFEMIKEK